MIGNSYWLTDRAQGPLCSGIMVSWPVLHSSHSTWNITHIHQSPSDHQPAHNHSNIRPEEWFRYEALTAWVCILPHLLTFPSVSNPIWFNITLCSAWLLSFLMFLCEPLKCWCDLRITIPHLMKELRIRNMFEIKWSISKSGVRFQFLIVKCGNVK